jgi:hypothetical protein
MKQLLGTDKIIRLICPKNIGPLVKVWQPWSNETFILKARAIGYGLPNDVRKDEAAYRSSRRSFISTEYLFKK